MDTKELVERYGMDEPVSAELAELRALVREVLALQNACRQAEKKLADFVRLT